MGSLTSKVDSNNNIVDIVSTNPNQDKNVILKYKNYVNSRGIINIKINVDNFKKSYDKYYSKFKNADSTINVPDFNNKVTGVTTLLSLGSMSGFYTMYSPVIKSETQNNMSPQIVVPKILLENNNEFIKFLLYDFNQYIQPTNPNDIKMKALYSKVIKAVLNGINKNTSRPEIRMANTMHLLIHIGIIGGIFTLVSNTSKLSTNESLIDELINEIVGDFFGSLPDDKCHFIKDNYIDFEPNICNMSRTNLLPTQSPSTPSIQEPLTKQEQSPPAKQEQSTQKSSTQDDSTASFKIFIGILSIVVTIFAIIGIYIKTTS